MRVLGIDPGLALVGYGVVDFEGSRLKVLECGCIQTLPSSTLPERLEIIEEQLDRIIKEFRPDDVAMEELFFNQNKTTGIQVAQARGVQILTCTKNGLPIYEYTPSQVKMAITGYGRASKRQMQESIKRLLRLDAIPKPDDAADALCIAVSHCFGNRMKEMMRMK